MRYIPEPRGYMGTSFRLRAKVSGGFTIRKISLQLPRTESSYWPSDSDIDSDIAWRRRLAASSAQAPESGSVDRGVPANRTEGSPRSSHPLWSAFPDYPAAPKVVRYPPGSHKVKQPSYPPLHPQQERRLAVCEPLPPNTEKVVRQVFEKHGVSTDGILPSVFPSSTKEASYPLSHSLLDADEDFEFFDEEIQLPPEILPPFSQDCPHDTACGAEYCKVFGCPEGLKRKLGSPAKPARRFSWHLREARYKPANGSHAE
ncbi:hypothetical protein CSUI_005635 [Cystoisospora suis]|uniref:Uncharacterized protein n=1 Tax=Cystoisospora suis TaxID=483139 RepID=A0A2C6KWW9_9APIC|nr:hypothetical protein CSUI_005635 [Cystoisospora suis]